MRGFLTDKKILNVDKLQWNIIISLKFTIKMIDKKKL